MAGRLRLNRDPFAVLGAAAVKATDEGAPSPFRMTVGHDQHEAAIVARVAILGAAVNAERVWLP